MLLDSFSPHLELLFVLCDQMPEMTPLWPFWPFICLYQPNQFIDGYQLDLKLYFSFYLKISLCVRFSLVSCLVWFYYVHQGSEVLEMNVQ